jgi:hypothetical protein
MINGGPAGKRPRRKMFETPRPFVGVAVFLDVCLYSGHAYRSRVETLIVVNHGRHQVHMATKLKFMCV